MSSYSIFLINIYLDIMRGETCSDHSNVGDSAVILLMPASVGEGERRKNGEKRRVSGGSCNSEKVTGFCVDLAEDQMPQESQCISGTRDGAKRLNSMALC